MMQLVYPGVIGNGEIYLEVMKAICGDTSGKSMVDLMCHHAPYTPLLGFEERTYVDILDRGLDHKEEQKYFVQSDVLDFLQKSKRHEYDVAICSDGIEHLERIYGVVLWTRMGIVAKKQIGFTPLGPCSISDDKNPDSHKSGWYPENFYGTASIVFPDFHKSIGHGAFFFWDCENLKEDFERVSNELKDKSWAKKQNM